MVLCHPTSKEEEPRFSLVGEMTDTRDDPNGEVSGSLRVNQEYLLMVKVPINVKQLSMPNQVEMKVVNEFVYGRR